jgi:hypothetical protein
MKCLRNEGLPMASRNLRHSGGPDPRLLPHRAMSKMDQLKSFIMAANAAAARWKNSRSNLMLLNHNGAKTAPITLPHNAFLGMSAAGAKRNFRSWRRQPCAVQNGQGQSPPALPPPESCPRCHGKRFWKLIDAIHFTRIIRHQTNRWWRRFKLCQARF